VWIQEEGFSDRDLLGRNVINFSAVLGIHQYIKEFGKNSHFGVSSQIWQKLFASSGRTIRSLLQNNNCKLDTLPRVFLDKLHNPNSVHWVGRHLTVQTITTSTSL